MLKNILYFLGILFTIGGADANMDESPAVTTTVRPPGVNTTQPFTQLPGNSTNVTCGFIANATSVPQYFNSPGYPNEHTNLLNCIWNFEAPVGYRIRLNFSEFNTESCCDHLTVYENGTQQVRWNGFRTAFSHVTFTNKVQLIFFTDGSVTRTGFRATFQITNEAPSTTAMTCGFIANATSVPQYFNSPGHPNEHPNFLNCIWNFEAPLGYRIRLSFSEFNTESCCDHLTVYENGMQQVRWNGIRTAFSHVTLTNRVQLIFFTDFSVTRTGFRASFQITNEAPSTTITPPVFNATTTSVPPTGTPTNNTSGTLNLVCPTSQCSRRAEWLCEYIRWRVEFLGEWQRTFEEWRTRYTSTLSGHGFYGCNTLYVTCVNSYQYGAVPDYYGCPVPFCADGLYRDIPQSYFQRWIADQALWRKLYGRWREALRLSQSQSQSSSCNP